MPQYIWILLGLAFAVGGIILLKKNTVRKKGISKNKAQNKRKPRKRK